MLDLTTNYMGSPQEPLVVSPHPVEHIGTS